MQLFLFESCYFLGYLGMIWNHFAQTTSPFTGIRPLRDLNNARVLSHSGSEEASGCSSRRKRKPTCYKEPSINRLGFKIFLPKTSTMLQPLLCSHVLPLQGSSVALFKDLTILCSVTLLFYHCVVMPKFCISTHRCLGFW